MKKEPNETELPDDYPLYFGYLYIVDGKVVRATEEKSTVAEWKRRKGCKSVKNCDIHARNLWDQII